MRKPLIAVACAAALAGCQTDGGGVSASPAPATPVQSSADIESAPGYVRPKDPQAFDAAKKTVVVKLKDPDSAKFTDLKRDRIPNAKGQMTDIVCGRVNAKNSYGGYTGAKPFVYFVGDRSSVLNEDEIAAVVVGNFCPELLR